MTTLSTLSKILPPDQALANKALSQSLRQVKNIFNTSLPEVANVVLSLESNKGLDLINALETPVPPSVQQFYEGSVGNGTGPGGTLVINDIIGTAAGATHNQALPIATTAVSNLEANGSLLVLTYDDGNPSSGNVLGIYTVMQYVLDGEYTTANVIPSPTPPDPPDTTVYSVTIPSPQPGQGTYGPSISLGNVYGNVFANLINLGNAAIASIAAANPVEATQSNDAYTAMAEQLVREQDNQAKAGIDFANLQPNAMSATMSIVTSLHEIGTQVSVGGPAAFFQATANTSTLSGQAVISAMREGRNLERLNSIGIAVDSQINDITPVIVDTSLITSGQYTVEEATGNVITG